jgi:arabinogalactan endo-1,4-beta-galactosidase
MDGGNSFRSGSSSSIRQQEITHQKRDTLIMTKSMPAIRPQSLSIIGADISSLQRSLELGAKYFYEDGREGDPVQILMDHGVNAIRLRVWVNPANGYNNKQKVTEFAARIKARGLKLLLNFHYSDTWADPAHQFKPAAWVNYDLAHLQQAVYEHTVEVCSSLKSAGAAPEMVQVGNEINPGMLLPDGSINNWDNLAALLKHGAEAVKTCLPEAQVMLHTANAGDKAGAIAWFDNARERGVAWDVIGLSYYSYWHSNIAAMEETVRTVRERYGKPVIIVETAYPFRIDGKDEEQNVIHPACNMPLHDPVTPEGQAGNLAAVIQAARTAGALGVFYWEPTWTAVPGNGWDPNNPASGNQWENQALFDYDSKALPAMRELKQ